MDAGDKKHLRDFAHTILVLSARVRAQNAQREAGRLSSLSRYKQASLPRRFVPRFELNLLAAATGNLNLPKAEILAEGGGLGITIVEREDEVQVTLQLKGFASLTAYAGREARLVSSDGSIDYAFRFSEGGTGLCVLANSPGIRAALGSLTVQIAES